MQPAGEGVELLDRVVELDRGPPQVVTAVAGRDGPQVRADPG